MESFAFSHQFSYPKLDRWDALPVVFCFIGSFILYVRTLTPGLLPGDSGEFQTLAYLLGNTHPTGYPIYLILAKLATYLPVGDIAYCVNLFSALMGALTVSGVYLAGRLLVKYRLLALVGAAALAVSPTFWSQAVIAEVYTAGAAFLVFIILALLLWERDENPHVLFSAGLLGGLSLGVHISVALLAPAVLLFLLLRRRRGKGLWRTAILGAVTGLLITILVFWLIDVNEPAANYFNSAIEPSRSSWGLAADEIDGPLERLLFGWGAYQFRSFMFSDIGKVMPRQAAAYWRNLPLELGWLLICFAVLGAVILLVRQTGLGVFLVVGLAVQWVCMFNYEIWDVYVFYIPSYILLALFSIAGMDALVDLGRSAIPKVISQLGTRWLPLAMEVSVALLVLGSAIWPIFHSRVDAVVAGENTFEFDGYPVYNADLEKIATAVVVNLPENAIVFTDWDMVWPYYYAAHIVEDRRDLTFVETYPADDVEGLAESVIEYVEGNLAAHSIFFSEREPALMDAGFSFGPARVGPVRLFRILDDL
jgi:hypothetical protein